MSERRSTDRGGGDVGWIVVLVVVTLFGAVNAVGALIGLVGGNWWPAISGALLALASYWFARGAWARTRWGGRE